MCQFKIIISINRLQILTTKVGPRTERVNRQLPNILIWLIQQLQQKPLFEKVATIGPYKPSMTIIVLTVVFLRSIWLH